MKTILLSLCLCFINLLSISSAAAQPPPPVLDTDGKELLARANYIILLDTDDDGHGFSGISLYNDEVGGGNISCPLDVVVQSESLFSVYFRPVNSTDGGGGVVRLSTDLNIIFNTNYITPPCPENPQWKLDYDESIRRNFVSTGGMVGNPGPKTINNWFKIEEFGSGYKFVFCPSVCATCRHVCGDLSVLVQDYDSQRLVLSIGKDDGPIMVKFQRRN